MTEAGRRLLWMLATEKMPNGTRWPRAFDARLVERIAEEFVPRIEAEALNVECLRAAIYTVSVRYRWSEVVDSEDRTEEIAAEYAAATARQKLAPETESEKREAWGK